MITHVRKRPQSSRAIVVEDKIYNSAVFLNAQNAILAEKQATSKPVKQRNFTTYPSGDRGDGPRKSASGVIFHIFNWLSPLHL
jgi:hypothetical protein